MRLAILGASSHIAKDLLCSLNAHGGYTPVLFTRNPAALAPWLASLGMAHIELYGFDQFVPGRHFDGVINFVGTGDPARAAAAGSSIIDVTCQFDNLVLSYLRHHPDCRYIFLSSGAAYGSTFDRPAQHDTIATVAINDLRPQSWYGAAKLITECRHRTASMLPIVDVRVFSYFSRLQPLSARFLISDMLRAIVTNTVMYTSAVPMVRDYLHPADFFSLVHAILHAPATNTAVDCYTRAPIGKQALLEAMQQQFGLRYEIDTGEHGVNATGSKPKYYSLNRKAAEFGYVPSLSSSDGIALEAAAILGQVNARLVSS